MFITKRHHNETLAAAHDETRVLERRLRAAESIIANKDAAIATLQQRVNWLDAAYDHTQDALQSAEAVSHSLRERLAPFERVRGKGGRFVSAKPVEYDPVRAAFKGECG